MNEKKKMRKLLFNSIRDNGSFQCYQCIYIFFLQYVLNEFVIELVFISMFEFYKFYILWIKKLILVNNLQSKFFFGRKVLFYNWNFILVIRKYE